MKTLERRLVDILEDEARRLPNPDSARAVAASPPRSQLLRPGFAAPLAVVTVMILAAPLIWLSTQRGGSESDATTPPTQPAAPPTTAIPVPPYTGLLGAVLDLVPDGFDPETAIPVFAAEGDVEEVVAEYVEARHLINDMGILQIEHQDGYTLVQWAWGRLLDDTGPERGLSGWLLTRQTENGFEIIAATTDGVDLSDLEVENGDLRGTIRSISDQYMGVDVLDLDGTPVESAPNPEGMPDAEMVWGTAADGTPPLAVDLAVTEPVVIRVNLVGGSLLSISELAFGQAASATEEVTVTTIDPSAAFTCPVTIPPNPGFVPPDAYPADHPDDSLVWYGTAGLWTALDVNGNHERGKEVWWSSNFPGGSIEVSPEVWVTATRLDTAEPETTSNEGRATNAYTPQEGWFMMSGTSSTGPGCFEITATYKGSTLTYVYEVG